FDRGSCGRCDPRGVIEKQTSGALPLLKPQPLSPNELTQPRSSTRSGFSVDSLMMPSAPALASAVFDPRRPSTSLPARFNPSGRSGAITTSAVTSPPPGVGPL